jgi:protein-disulfide isomerase
MKSGTAVPSGAPSAAQNAAAPSGAPAGPQTATLSLDDDPVMGDRKKAKVAIVEFSDFECPFCQKFHKESYDTLVKDYVDSGKAVISFRDYPLPFHEPKASVAAETAQCVKAAKGDAAYFKFSKLYFENTATNGKGLPEGKMDEILKQSGVTPASVNDCATKETFKDEIAKDMSDGQAAGVSGTPSFVIGKLSADGKVEGELVVGALPLAQLKTTIDKYLK